MATSTRPAPERAGATDGWYRLPAEQVAVRLGVDPHLGLSSRQAATLLARQGPNALPVERAVPGWRRFADVAGWVLASETFDNARMNRTALAELVLAVLVTQMDAFNRLFDTKPLTAPQFGLALAATVLLLGLWETGKLIARRRAPLAEAGALG